MIFPLLFTFAGLTALIATYLFIYLCYRAAIDNKRAEIEMMNARMKFQAFQERQTALDSMYAQRRY